MATLSTQPSYFDQMPISFFQLFIPRVIVMYALGMMAFAFYITKFPERFIPGKILAFAFYITKFPERFIPGKILAFVVVVVVALLFYVHGKHLRSCRDGQLT